MCMHNKYNRTLSLKHKMLHKKVCIDYCKILENVEVLHLAKANIRAI